MLTKVCWIVKCVVNQMLFSWLVMGSSFVQLIFLIIMFQVSSVYLAFHNSKHREEWLYFNRVNQPCNIEGIEREYHLHLRVNSR
jgi:hypothetical protein